MMNDSSANSTTNQVEEWMETMGFYLSPDELKSICSSEKAYTGVSALVNRVRPKETVKRAKLFSLYSKVKKYGIESDNSKLDPKLELLKTRIKLKNQLKQKEITYAEKKEECAKLIKEIEDLLQRMQCMNSVLNEENKKLFFLKLNKKALEGNLEIYCSLRQTISEVLKDHQRKRKDKYFINLDAQVVEAVNECQARVICSKRKMKEQFIIDNTGCEYDNNRFDPAAGNWKSEMLEYVTQKMENLPWIQVFHALLETLRQQVHSIQSLQSRSCVSSSPDPIRSSVCSGKMQAQEILERVFIKNGFDAIRNTPEKGPCETSQEEDKNNLQVASPDMLLVEKNALMEKLSVVEIQLKNVDKCIRETTEECKNLKTRVINNLKEMGQTISFIKHFPKKLELIQKEDVCPIPLLDELHGLMHQFCTAGMKEIQLFAEIPLVAIEKITLANEKVPAYELASSFLKVISSTSKKPSSYQLMMRDATSLLPCDLLIHVWKQLSFLCMLHKTHSLIKLYTGNNVDINFESHSLDEECKKIELTYHNFLAALSTFETGFDQVTNLMDCLEEHPLNSVVPNDLLVDGLSIQYFINLCKKVESGN